MTFILDILAVLAPVWVAVVAIGCAILLREYLVDSAERHAEPPPAIPYDWETEDRVPDDFGPLIWRESGTRLGHAYQVRQDSPGQPTRR